MKCGSMKGQELSLKRGLANLVKHSKDTKDSREPVEGLKQGNFIMTSVVLEVFSPQCRE